MPNETPTEKVKTTVNIIAKSLTSSPSPPSNEYSKSRPRLGLLRHSVSRLSLKKGETATPPPTGTPSSRSSSSSAHSNRSTTARSGTQRNSSTSTSTFPPTDVSDDSSSSTDQTTASPTPQARQSCQDGQFVPEGQPRVGKCMGESPAGWKDRNGKGRRASRFVEHLEGNVDGGGV